MVTTTYKCGVCKRGYKDRAKATKCEKQGIIGGKTPIAPGLVFERTLLDDKEVRGKDSYEKVLIVLKRGSQKGHNIEYRVGEVMFGTGVPGDEFDRWSEYVITFADLKQRMKEGKIVVPGRAKLSGLQETISQYQEHMARELANEITREADFSEDMRAQIIWAARKYDFSLHNKSPFKR